MANKKTKSKKPKQANKPKQSGQQGGSAAFGDYGSSQPKPKKRK